MNSYINSNEWRKGKVDVCPECERPISGLCFHKDQSQKEIICHECALRLRTGVSKETVRRVIDDLYIPKVPHKKCSDCEYMEGKACVHIDGVDACEGNKNYIKK